MSLITGPGRYLTRGGKEVDVFRNDDSEYPWAYGYRGGQITVDDDGYQLRSGSPVNTDIIAKAPEAAPTKEEASRLEDGGHAFPTGSWEYDGRGNVLPYQEPGMSLRDYFAAKAMAALAVDPERADQSREECARLSYLMADAMLAARGRA